MKLIILFTVCLVKFQAKFNNYTQQDLFIWNLETKARCWLTLFVWKDWLSLEGANSMHSQVMQLTQASKMFAFYWRFVDIKRGLTQKFSIPPENPHKLFLLWGDLFPASSHQVPLLCCSIPCPDLLPRNS